MKTVTAAFTDTLKAPSTPFVRQVYYKRRYWVESSKAYTWESNWTLLSEDKVAGCSQITWQLDIQTLNQFQTANITLKLENLQNQWRGDNPYGKFAKDSTSPVYGYYPYWTKFQIRAGVIESDHTTETVPVFTGVATEFNYDTVSGTVQVTVSGEESLLINANAEAVSTTVTNETLTGTVNGTNKVFTTAQSGVGIITEVSDNGITKRQGADYTISNLNTPATVATITFAAAPSSGHTIRGSYIYWKANQKFEDLVTSLLNQAGIPGGSQHVSPVLFPSNVINTHVWNTQSLWQGGSSLTAIDTTSIPNSIEYQYTTAQTWNNATTGWTSSGGTFGADSTGLKFDYSGGAYPYAYRAQTNVYGDWSVSFLLASPGSGSDYVAINVGIIIGSVVGTNNHWANSLVIFCQAFANHAGDFVSLRTTDGSGNFGTGFASANQTITFGATHTIRVRRRPTALHHMDFYYDGTLLFTADDNSFNPAQPTASNDFGYFVTSSSASPPTTYFTVNGVSTPTTTDGLATWISDAVDFSSTPTAWTQYLKSDTLNGGTVTYYTASSGDNITYDAYVAVPANGVVASTLRRYLKTKAVIDITSGDPSVASITVGAITTSTGVTLANFTGMSCYDAITALGKFANYEFGFAPDESFYFRPKAVTKSAVMAIDQTLFNLTLDQVVNGYDRVYSAVRATYAGYIKDIVDDGLNYAGPLVTQGFIRIAIDGGNILVSADADVATGVAGSFFNYFKYPRRRVKVTTKIIPQLDLSDVIQVTLSDNLLKGWYVGDTSVVLGDATLAHYGGEEQVVYGLIMKVIGVRIDTDNWLMQMDLEEVL